MSRQHLCPPYYSVVYDALLAEEVTRCLNNGLKEIAEEKAKTICETFLGTIKEHKLTNISASDGNGKTNNNVLETWQKISSCDFYLTESNTQIDLRDGADANPPTSPPV